MDRPLDGRTAYLRPAIAVMKTSELTERYYDFARFTPLCRDCASYGRNYACPPLPFDAGQKLKGYAYAQLIAAKLSLPERVAPKPGRLSMRLKHKHAGTLYRYGRVFAYSYEPGAEPANRFMHAKRAMDERLILLESAIPGSMAASAGACGLCARCGRAGGEPCRRPDRARVSLDAFSLNLTAIARDIFGMPLLWQHDGAPGYLVLMSALFADTPEGRL